MSPVALAAVDVTAPAQSLLRELVSGRETPWIVRERAVALCSQWAAAELSSRRQRDQSHRLVHFRFIHFIIIVLLYKCYPVLFVLTVFILM